MNPFRKHITLDRPFLPKGKDLNAGNADTQLNNMLSAASKAKADAGYLKGRYVSYSPKPKIDKTDSEDTKKEKKEKAKTLSKSRATALHDAMSSVKEPKKHDKTLEKIKVVEDKVKTIKAKTDKTDEKVKELEKAEVEIDKILLKELNKILKMSSKKIQEKRTQLFPEPVVTVEEDEDEDEEVKELQPFINSLNVEGLSEDDFNKIMEGVPKKYKTKKGAFKSATIKSLVKRGLKYPFAENYTNIQILKLQRPIKIE